MSYINVDKLFSLAALFAKLKALADLLESTLVSLFHGFLNITAKSSAGVTGSGLQRLSAGIGGSEQATPRPHLQA